MPKSRVLSAVVAYGAATALCLFLLARLLKLWQADLIVPFAYHGDAVFFALWIKGIAETGWYLHNPMVGMPLGLDFHDFAMGDLFHFVVLKGLTALSPRPGLVMNLFFLLSFPLATVAALFVFRRFGLGYVCSLVGSLVFTFLPYHFMRGEYHAFLAAYYPVPLAAMVILWVCAGGSLRSRAECEVRGAKPEGSVPLRTSHLALRTARSAPRSEPLHASVTSLPAAIAICALLSVTGFYYALFACYFLIIAGLWASCRRRSAAPARTAALLIGVIALGLAVDLFPTLSYRHRHGANPEVARRRPSDAEMLGLKIDQLLLPIPGHRLPPLARVRGRYDATLPAPNENGTASLGLFGSIGFLFLLGCLVLTGSPRLPADLQRLAVLNLAALLLGTVGGFGALVAFLLSPMVRGYNRISVYIAFFAIFAVTSSLDRLYRRYARAGLPRLAGALALGLVLFAAVLDQTSPYFRPEYAALKREFGRDARFVQRIEAAVPAKSMVFQLPYQPFPENSGPCRMLDYDPLKGYLHSRKLRWSYAAMIGREADRWQRTVVAKPAPAMVRALSAAGFRAICIDRSGYPDRGARIEAKLAALLRVLPIESEDRRRACYLLEPARRRTGIEIAGKTDQCSP